MLEPFSTNVEPIIASIEPLTEMFEPLSINVEPIPENSSRDEGKKPTILRMEQNPSFIHLLGVVSTLLVSEDRFYLLIENGYDGID